jgi:hypothetical protein
VKHIAEVTISRAVAAVDGRSLGQSYLDRHGIRMLPGFSEPYHNRPLTLGEIGCFMSHYTIWQVLQRHCSVDIFVIFRFSLVPGIVIRISGISTSGCVFRDHEVFGNVESMRIKKKDIELAFAGFGVKYA